MKNENTHTSLWFMVHKIPDKTNKIDTSIQKLTESCPRNTQININHINSDDKIQGEKLIEEANNLITKAMNLIIAGEDIHEVWIKYGNEAKKKFNEGKKLLGN